MPAKMERTRHPGIYKRGGNYVVVYRIAGRQRKEAVRTLKQALALKAARVTDRDRGEFQELSKRGFRDYAAEWIVTYQGTGKRGFTEGSRDDYQRDLERYAYPFFDERLGRTLASITPRDVARWIAWLTDEHEQGRRLAEEQRRRNAEREGRPINAIPAVEAQPLRLSDATLRRLVAPVRSCLATAKREGLIRHNPADGTALPHRPRIEEDEERRALALSREQLGLFLRVVHPDYKLMFQFLAATGMRWSELIALRWCDLELDGIPRRAKVRRAIVKGRLKPPKSKYGRRDIPLSSELVGELRIARTRAPYGADDDPVFASQRGNPPNHANVMRRYLKPAAGEIEAPWAGFHTFRHTCASLLFDGGRNIRQVQHWLGHHSPSFTLDTYVHLLDEGVGEGLDLDAEIRQGGNTLATRRVASRRTEGEPIALETAL